MDHQGQSRCRHRLKASQKVSVVMQRDTRHMGVVPSCVVAHEDLESQTARVRQLWDLLRHRARWIVIEIHQGLLPSQLDDLVEPFSRCGWRVHVWHANGEGIPARRSGPGGGGDVLLVSKPRLPVVGVGVNATGNHVPPLGVDNLGSLGCRQAGAHPRDLSPLRQYVGMDEPSRRPNGTSLDE